MRKLLILLVAVLLTACIPCGCNSAEAGDQGTEVKYTSSSGDKIKLIRGATVIVFVEKSDGSIVSVSCY